LEAAAHTLVLSEMNTNGALAPFYTDCLICLWDGESQGAPGAHVPLRPSLPKGGHLLKAIPSQRRTFPGTAVL